MLTANLARTKCGPNNDFPTLKRRFFDQIRIFRSFTRLIVWKIASSEKMVIRYNSLLSSIILNADSANSIRRSWSTEFFAAEVSVEMISSPSCKEFVGSSACASQTHTLIPFNQCCHIADDVLKELMPLHARLPKILIHEELTAKTNHCIFSATEAEAPRNSVFWIMIKNTEL